MSSDERERCACRCVCVQPYVKMSLSAYETIRDSMERVHMDDDHPSFLGFSGGQDNTMVASQVFGAGSFVSTKQRRTQSRSRADTDPGVRIQHPRLLNINGNS